NTSSDMIQIESLDHIIKVLTDVKQKKITATSNSVERYQRALTTLNLRLIQEPNCIDCLSQRIHTLGSLEQTQKHLNDLQRSLSFFTHTTQQLQKQNLDDNDISNTKDRQTCVICYQLEANTLTLCGHM